MYLHIWATGNTLDVCMQKSMASLFLTVPHGGNRKEREVQNNAHSLLFRNYISYSQQSDTLTTVELSLLLNNC